MSDYEFVIKRAEPETAKERFLNNVASKDSGYFLKTVYETANKLNSFDGHGDIAQLIDAGMSASWFAVQCNVCSLWHEKVVSFDINDGEYDYDICAECLRGAIVALVKE